MHPFIRNLVVFGAFGVLAAAHAQTKSLGAMAKDANLNFGLAVGSQFFTGNAAYREGIRTGFNLFVNENDMKFSLVEPSRGRFSFDRPAQVVAFAEANGIRMRGHTLVWHNQSGWAEGNFSRSEMLDIMKNHIETTVGRFKGRILEWDVVNEAINNGTSFMVWGFDDAHSWKTTNGTCHCLLYDTGLQPKLALHNALREKLAAADPAVSLARKAFAGSGGTGLSAAQRKPNAAQASRQRVGVVLFPAPGKDAGLYNVSGKHLHSRLP